MQLEYGKMDQAFDKMLSQGGTTFPKKSMTLSEIQNRKEMLGWYIEDFDPKTLPGAAWGQAMPVIESLRLKQEQASSCWDPFMDEEEWELAEWLVHNLKQKQTDIFLKMHIVCYFYNLESILMNISQIRNQTKITYENSHFFFTNDWHAANPGNQMDLQYYNLKRQSNQ